MGGALPPRPPFESATEWCKLSCVNSYASLRVCYCIHLLPIVMKCTFYCARKVTLMEDAEQNIHLKNLSSHEANNEEQALNLLFLGDTNRMIAEVTAVYAYHSSVNFCRHFISLSVSWCHTHFHKDII